ncbi:1347_t:CDS:2, partial [Acaulospora colombiana]
LPSNSWEQIAFPSNDVTGIRITSNIGSFTIFNIYNDCTHNSTLELLSEHITADKFYPTTNDHMLWFGDFNRHHPMWEPPENRHLRSSSEAVDPLLNLILEHGMEMALPKYEPTLLARNGGRPTRPDNVWRTSNDPNPFIKCYVERSAKTPITDHFAILSILDFPLPRNDTEPYRKFREVDWTEFNEILTSYLANSPEFRERYTSREELSAGVIALTNAITSTIDICVPLAAPCAYAKRWWTRELTELKKAKNRASAEAHKWRYIPEHPSHEAYHSLSTKYVTQIRKTKEEHWISWLEGLNDHDIWNVNKYLAKPASDLCRERIPTLKTPDGTPTSNNSDKAKLLSNTFFPPPPSTIQLPNIPFPNPVGKFKPYSRARLISAIKTLKPYKAPGPDGIPNVVLKECAEVLATPLLSIFNGIFQLHYYPPEWKLSTTVVLRKPGKPAYDVPNAYRPIALLNTMPKLLSALVAEDITYICEAHQLLPNTQFGGRPRRTTADAIHLLTHKVKDAWRKHQVASALFLDIQAAFPNVVRQVLLRNMRTKGIPKEYVAFIDHMLTNRYTKLRFDDFTSEDIPINNGNSQGCPLSMLLYAFYIAPLLEIANGKNELTIGFVDDTTLLAIGRTFIETHATLKSMMERAKGALAWSKGHNSPFELSKVAVIDFTRSDSKERDSSDLLLTYCGRDQTRMSATVKVVKSYKLLGILIDSKLTWAKHHDLVQARAIKWTALFKRLNRVTTGISLELSRRLYLGVAIPRITYAAETWFVPPYRLTDAQKGLGNIGLSRKLSSIQRQAAITITGAMRTTAGDALEAHADLYPIDILLTHVCYQAAARLATLPPTHPLHPYVKKKSTPIAGRLTLRNASIHISQPTKTKQKAGKNHTARTT